MYKIVWVGLDVRERRIVLWFYDKWLQGRPPPPKGMTQPSLPSPPFPSLRSMTPSNPVRRFGGALWTPPVGSGAQPQPKSTLLHFSLKIWHLVATILIIIFLRIKWPNLVQFKHSKLCPPKFLIFVPRGFLCRRECLWTPPCFSAYLTSLGAWLSRGFAVKIRCKYCSVINEI